MCALDQPQWEKLGLLGGRPGALYAGDKHPILMVGSGAVGIGKLLLYSLAECPYNRFAGNSYPTHVQEIVLKSEFKFFQTHWFCCFLNLFSRKAFLLSFVWTSQIG